MNFSVSVITPVYNAAEFVTRAVESALAQPETAEVLLIEDGSPDNSLVVCQGLAEKYENVKLLRHPNGENCGAGASRNLGMRNAACEYIAFLDADDYYLPERFAVAKHIILNDPSCGGVYEAIGMHVENKDGLARWKQAGKLDTHLQTMKQGIAPVDLPAALLSSSKYGFFHLDGFTIKRTMINKTGLMDENLRLHQDTEFMLRCSIVAKLWPGRLDEPVAMWCVHQQNRISAPRSEVQKLDERRLMWKIFYLWLKKEGYHNYRGRIMRAILSNTISQKRFPNYSSKGMPQRFFRLGHLFIWLLHNPRFIFDSYMWQSLRDIKKNVGK